MGTPSDDIEGFHAEWTAAELNGDSAALENLQADDFTRVGPLGFTLSKQDWLSRHAAGISSTGPSRSLTLRFVAAATPRW